MNSKGYTMHEIIENYGPIMASDQDYGILVSVNGSYFNIWCATGRPGLYENTEALHFGSRLDSDNGMYGVDICKIMDVAKKILNDAMKQEEG